MLLASYLTRPTRAQRCELPHLLPRTMRATRTTRRSSARPVDCRSAWLEWSCDPRADCLPAELKLLNDRTLQLTPTGLSVARQPKALPTVSLPNVYFR